MKAAKGAGNNPIFPSFHDCNIRGSDLFRRDVNGRRTRKTDEQAAFADFRKSLDDNPKWRGRFTAEQVAAIEKALETNGPKIEGFTWHHHEESGDGGTLQLVDRKLHGATGHTGGWRLHEDDLAEKGTKPRPKN